MLVPFTINGFAVREAFFVSFLGKLGVDADSAFACGFLFFVMTLVLALPGFADHLLGGRAAARPPCRMADVSVVVVTYNGMPWIEQCLESVRGHETIVVDHGSTDGTVELVRERFPDAVRDRAGERRHGRRQQRGHARGAAATGSSCSTRTPGCSATGSSGWSRSPRRAPTRRSSGRGCATPTARCSAPSAASRRCGGSRPSTSASASSRRARARLNAFYAGDFDHDAVREVESLHGAALLVRRAATDAVGLFDEAFFMFSEETDWLHRFRAAGWKVLFFPGAEVAHVGGASHGGRLARREPARDPALPRKHRGLREAERARRLLLWSLRLRGARRSAASADARYRDGARFLASGDVARRCSRERPTGRRRMSEYLRLAFGPSSCSRPAGSSPGRSASAARRRRSRWAPRGGLRRVGR